MSTLSAGEAILLGAIQGLTEFLPVSSSGHLALVEKILSHAPAESVPFDISVHLATLGAILVVFRRDVVRMFTTERRILLLVAVGSVPAAVFGYLCGGPLLLAVKSSHLALGAAFLFSGGYLVWGERRAAGDGGRELTTVDAVLVGLGQAVAIAPGISRSGTTVSTGLALGVEKDRAVSFSFMLAIPAILGAAALRYRELADFAASDLGPLAAGFAAAFVTGLAAAFAFIAIVRRSALSYFGYYCLVVGAAAVAVGTIITARA